MGFVGKFELEDETSLIVWVSKELKMHSVFSHEHRWLALSRPHWVFAIGGGEGLRKGYIEVP